jgi:hypothetical protein
MFGKNKKQEKLLANLDQEFIKIQHKYHLPPGDFPNPERFRQNLSLYNMDKFKPLKEDIIARVDEALSVDLPRLMSDFPQGNPMLEEKQRNPFAGLESYDAQTGNVTEDFWTFAAVDRESYAGVFRQIGPRDGKISGSQIKPVLMESGLPNDILAQVWRLADWDNDGYMDLDEFAVAMHLIKAAQRNEPLPEKLPQSLMPGRKL